MKETPRASQHFNENWQKYQEILHNNTLYHREMSEALDTFLKNHLGSREFSFVDIGCGDASPIVPVLSDKPLKQYIGIDAASEVLKLAEKNLSSLNCAKTFICDNMINAINQISDNVDVIFSSYALHHLSRQEKFDFFQTCQNKLSKSGFLLMIDGVLKENQTRDEWLADLEHNMTTTLSLPIGEINFRMQHPRNDDFPEEIATFKEIAAKQQWKKCEVLVNKEIYGFIAFYK